jgi:hypothetical protein
VLETVAVHELAHLRVFGHGPSFWALVAGRMPDHVARRRWLRAHAAELHAALAETDLLDIAQGPLPAGARVPSRPVAEGRDE